MCKDQEAVGCQVIFASGEERNRHSPPVYSKTCNSRTLRREVLNIMPFKEVRTETVSQEELQLFKKDEEDYEWFSSHAQEIETQYRGKFVAVINQHVFAGESWKEAQDKAKLVYPDRELIIEHIPWKRKVQVL